MKNLWLALLTCLPLALHAGNDISKVNGSIRVSAPTPAGDVSTVNGSISIEEDVTAEDVSTVNGSITLAARAAVQSIETVNGTISLGEAARATSIETVNGRLRFDSGAQASGDVTAVNGSVSLAKDARIAGRLSNVNGTMQLSGAYVGGGLETTNGDIYVGAGSHVQDGILVEKPSRIGFGWRKQPPEIVIGPEAVVEGTLKFEHEVELYVSDRAKVGPIEGAKAIRFTGDEPGRAEREAAELQLEK